MSPLGNSSARCWETQALNRVDSTVCPHGHRVTPPVFKDDDGALTFPTAQSSLGEVGVFECILVLVQLLVTCIRFILCIYINHQQTGWATLRALCVWA